MSRFDSLTVEASIRPSGLALQVESCELTVDEGWSPFGQGRLVCRIPADRNLVDLRAGYLEVDLQLLRAFGRFSDVATITAENYATVADITTAFGGQQLAALTNRYFRPFAGAQVRDGEQINARLPIIDRVFEEESGQLTLTVATGEALLQADALVATVPLNPGTTSLKTIVGIVLARYAAALTPSAVDATVAQVEATIWRPGVTAADYLRPMLEAASLRLWCDLDGTWRLTARQSTIDGSVSLAGAENLTAFADRMSLDPDVWSDAVVIEYSWVDAANVQRTAYDVAGTQPSRACLVIKREAVFPGPGAAAGILNRAQGRGRTLDISATLNLLARPGMAAQISPLVGDTQTGIVSAVTWRAPEAQMSVTTRGLVDTPPTAYLFGALSKTYNAAPLSVTYNNFDWSLLP